MKLKVRSDGDPLGIRILIVRDDGSEEDITGSGICSVQFSHDGTELPVVTLGFELADFEGAGLGALAEKDLDAALRIIQQMGPLPEHRRPPDDLAP